MDRELLNTKNFEFIYYRKFDLIYFKFIVNLDSPRHLFDSQYKLYGLQKKYNCLKIFQDASYNKLNFDEATMKVMTRSFSDFFSFLPNTRTTPYEGKDHLREEWKEMNKSITDNFNINFFVCGDLKESIEYLFNTKHNNIEFYNEIFEELSSLVKS